MGESGAAAFDATVLRRWAAFGLQRLEQHRRELDADNVFPVADGDTGANLVATWRAVRDAVVDAGAGPAGWSAACSGGLLGARGNSGAIVCQLVHGMAEVLGADDKVDGARLAAALRRGADAARAAVAVPVEGTVLSVAAAAATGSAAAGSLDLLVTARAAVEAARTALANTPGQLAVLRDAGVVDAGGRGLVLLLEALALALDPQADLEDPRAQVEAAAERPSPGPRAAPAADSAGPTYEVQYLLEATAAAVDRLRPHLAALGDSLVVVGGVGPPGEPATWNVHVHVDDVGSAVERGVEAGRPHRITVTRFADQAGGCWPTGDGMAPPAVEPSTVVLALVPTGELVALFQANGAQVLTVGEHAPSPAEVATTIRETGASDVLVLPTSREAMLPARQAGRRLAAHGPSVLVVPCRSPVQALAALAVGDLDAGPAEAAVAMTAAAAGCRYGEVLVVAAASMTTVGVCQPGEALGLVDGEVVEIGADPGAVALSVVDRLVGPEAELVTVLSAPDHVRVTERVTARVQSRHPLVELSCHPGLPAPWVLQIGVE